MILSRWIRESGALSRNDARWARVWENMCAICKCADFVIAVTIAVKWMFSCPRFCPQSWVERGRMMVRDIDEMLEQGEGLSVEFKRCGAVPEKDTFETVCSFANR